MPGVQKGKKHKPGAGRPPLSSQPTVRLTITLPADMAAAIKRFGGGKVSAGVRRLYDEFFGSIDDEEKP